MSLSRKITKTIKSEMNKNFSPQAARLAAKKKDTHDWVCRFLDSSGGNQNMAQGMRRRFESGEVYWLGPINFPLNKLTRCCGPEEGLEYPEVKKKWIGKLDKLREAIKAGEKLPVIIVNPRPWPILSIRDGNHRYEALCLEKKKKYWTLFWFDSKEDEQKFKREYKNFLK